MPGHVFEREGELVAFHAFRRDDSNRARYAGKPGFLRRGARKSKYSDCTGVNDRVAISGIRGTPIAQQKTRVVARKGRKYFPKPLGRAYIIIWRFGGKALLIAKSATRYSHS